MSITKTVVGRPTTTAIIFVLLIALGFYAISDLAIDLYPDIEPPVLLLFTDYSGAGPEEVEKRITRPLEGGLSNVGNIEEITSTSAEGNSMIQIEFTWGTDMAEAANDVRDKLEFVKDMLPEEASTPQIFKFDPSMIPIMYLNVSGNRSPEDLREIAEKIIQPRLEQVEGVALVSVAGGRQRIIRVEVPQNRLEAYNLTLTQIQGMLQQQNVSLSGGSVGEGNINYLVSTAGDFQSIKQIRDSVIAYKAKSSGAAAAAGYSPTQTIRLGDLANVYDGYADETNAIFINGKDGVFLTVQKQSGTNSVRTADNVLERIRRINTELPAGVQMAVIYDTTKIIRASLQQVSSSAITGGILAVVILLLFLRSFRTTLIIGLTIPISFVITLMLMYFAGLTLNIMTLSGLALGIGMLVDNSIVILENIFRYREKGAKLKTSAVIGTREMINAIVASTLTTICVFAPLAIFKSQLAMIGELFAGLSFTVVISLLSSLAVAMFLVPVLSSHYLPIRSNLQRPRKGLSKRIDDFLGGFFNALDELYKRSLARVLRHKLLTILLVVLIFAGSLSLLTIASYEFMPEMDDDFIELSVELPLGTRLELTKDVMRQLESIARDEIQAYSSLIVSAGERSFFGFLGSLQTHKGTLSITLPPYQERVETSTQVEQILRSHFNEFPSAVFEFTAGGPGGGGTPIDVLVKTDDMELGRETAYRIRDLMKEEIPEITEPVVSLQEGLPELDIVIDRDRAYELGLTMAAIGQEIRANVEGVTASRYNDEGNEYDILLILPEEDRNEIPDLEKIFVVNSAGQHIPLASFASTTKTTGPVSINRENQTRTIHVQGGLAPGAKLQEVELGLRRLIADRIPVNENVVLEYSGDYAELMEYGMKFVVILIISILLVFGVMASQFESFLDPFIIFFTIPLVLVGVILIYILTGQSFSIFTAVGLVMLVGIVVNNGIVLVDYTNLLRKRGMSITEACIEAGGNRLRPILMTSLTTILALVPMAFFAGEGAELVQPIGKTVVGGLSVATLLTLFLVPVLYALLNGRAEKRALKRRQKS
ncbi:acriflavin resistance protein [Marispirochaeta aestuarii]|uniref:Acriflavin resistance protein n=1 Tax=Marispirochaeta aestuarii TaxID=1963862 RepID=A0A1Y1RV32_9SPIO|nr:efflux RND transporter permease subunit [Marispirochaeta aestuarii]ORC32978.1 acriflavin resistance protein [Marispirochaeta aestuarii]